MNDPVVTKLDIEHAGAKSVALRELLSQSDVISLHCPSMAETRGMINRDALAVTKRGVILINGIETHTARRRCESA